MPNRPRTKSPGPSEIAADNARYPSNNRMQEAMRIRDLPASEKLRELGYLYE